MDIKKCIEIGAILRNQLSYDKNRVIELILEEYRLNVNQTAELIKEVFKEADAKEAGQLLMEFFDYHEVKDALSEIFSFSGSDWEKWMDERNGVHKDPVTINTHITEVRANDFGHEYRAYIGLENIGNGKAGWGYLVPGNPGSNAIMEIATKAKIQNQELYVYGRIDEDGEKIKILELGLK